MNFIYKQSFYYNFSLRYTLHKAKLTCMLHANKEAIFKQINLSVNILIWANEKKKFRYI